MNERIKELANQCWESQLSSIGAWYAAFNEEKFAVLCFLECAKWMSDGNIPDGGYEAERMLKHFGVKE